MKRILVMARSAVLVCLVVPVMAMSASSWSIDALMNELAQAEPARARFVEKKTMAMLEEPIVSSGELAYIAPDRLERKTLKPRAETMVVEGESVTIERGGRIHTLSMQEYPELAGLIDSIRGTLAGNRQMLERSFSLKLEGSRPSWILTLVPTDAKLARMLRHVRVEGSRDRVRIIELEQRDGDSSVMTIEPIAGK